MQGRLSVRRLSIRRKLAAAVVVPLVTLVVVCGNEVAASRAEAREVREQSRLAQATLGPDGLLVALQDEAAFASASAVGFEGEGLTVASNEEARRATDDSIEDFRRHVEQGGDHTVAAYAGAIEGFGGLRELRATLDAHPGPNTMLNADAQALADETYQGYAAVTEGVFDANDRIAGAVDDPTLRTGTDLVNQAARQAVVAGDLLRATAAADFSDGGIDNATELPEIAILMGDFDRRAEDMAAAAVGPYRPAVERLGASEEIDRFRSTVEDVVRDPARDPLDLLDVNVTLGDSDYSAFREEVAGLLAEEADARNDDATAAERRFLLFAVLVVTTAFVATALTGRSIIRPLRSLTSQAADVAERRLPSAVRAVLDRPLGEDVAMPQLEPVRVATRDEVGEVADALSSVQVAAVELAVEQAVLRRNIADSFVSLGRRNQNLLSRQLDFITGLESDEADPDRLASLFRLDHLATRMRRNAESLLVLAGVQPARTWSAPIPITDVVRSALGEVDGYERVTLTRADRVSVVGASAGDLAHLLAELVENALQFSPPHQPVEVSGAAGGGGYVLTVVDHGFGMSADELRQANRRLAGDESFTVAPSKYLGHYVAGSLAANHGISVRLDGAPGRGVTAAVTLPPHLLVGAGPPAPGPAGAGAGAGAEPAPEAWLPRSPFVPAVEAGPGRVPSTWENV